jgi:hypothetical protein
MQTHFQCLICSERTNCMCMSHHKTSSFRAPTATSVIFILGCRARQHPSGRRPVPPAAASSAWIHQHNLETRIRLNPFTSQPLSFTRQCSLELLRTADQPCSLGIQAVFCACAGHEPAEPAAVGFLNPSPHSAASHAAAIVSGAAIAPCPTSPHASFLLTGSMTVTPS